MSKKNAANTRIILRKIFDGKKSELYEQILYKHPIISSSQQGHTVKTVIVATSVKQAICIKQACIPFPEKGKCMENAPVLSKHLFEASTMVIGCLFNTGWTVLAVSECTWV